MRNTRQVIRSNTPGADESGTRANEPKTCACCGTPIDMTEWHPLVTRTNDDGSFQVFAFCSRDCKTTWLNVETSEDPGER